MRRTDRRAPGRQPRPGRCDRPARSAASHRSTDFKPVNPFTNRSCADDRETVIPCRVTLVVCSGSRHRPSATASGSQLKASWHASVAVTFAAPAGGSSPHEYSTSSEPSAVDGARMSWQHGHDRRWRGPCPLEPSGTTSTRSTSLSSRHPSEPSTDSGRSTPSSVTSIDDCSTGLPGSRSDGSPGHEHSSWHPRRGEHGRTASSQIPPYRCPVRFHMTSDATSSQSAMSGNSAAYVSHGAQRSASSAQGAQGPVTNGGYAATATTAAARAGATRSATSCAATAVKWIPSEK